MLPAILRSAALMAQGPGEPRRLQVRSSIYLHKRLQGIAAVELWTLRHTDKERPVFDNQRLPPPPTSSLSGAILNPFPSIKQKPGYPVSLTAMVTAGGTNKAHIERLYTKPVWFPYHYFNNRQWPCEAREQQAFSALPTFPSRETA